ncbi:FAD-binding protein [Nocardioides sp. HM23]|uniref:FAD-dependent oxidoreductase n=1 Tax=Nocardioides bizhenqiangii TaxID=3095076 RepID=UPI002ACA7E96|nr:FAD-binding protein [Nocardioides sp. HM23]MDZ5621014.1 FAD-binding protein [Nocardioides sp. HM23]
MEPDLDLLVIGGGMGGLTAAANAARNGLSVIVIEIGADVGGSGRYAGYIWTAPTREVMEEQNPGGDRELRELIVDNFAEAVAWIDSSGVRTGQAQRILPFGVGHRFDTNRYVDTCRKIVEEAGGEVWLRATPSDLLEADGAVVGARVTTSDGRSSELRARYTLIATGGFQGSTQLREELVGPGAGNLPVRSNPHSCGGGMDLARAVGAATGFERAGFYGHLVPSGIPFAVPSDFVDLSLYFSEHALLFNLDGERFSDETLGDHLTTIALSEQPEARGLLVADSRVHRTWSATPYVEGAEVIDKFALATRRGGRTGVAGTLAELDLLPEEWGYDGPKIRQAVGHFNARAGASQVLTPGRRLDAAPLDEPPFYVIEAIPAITFPFCGIKVDSRARVVDATGAVIPGLLAAGSDTGGLWNRAYAGGVASAVVFGLIASATARTHGVRSAPTTHS